MSLPDGRAALEALQEVARAYPEATWSIAATTLGTEAWSLHWQAERSYYPASVIKLPIMVSVYRAAAQGWLRLDEEIPLSPDDLVGGAGILQDLTPGIRLPVRDLVTLMIVLSDNTATNMLLTRLGTPFVNETCRFYGWHDTAVHNPLMVVPLERTADNRTSARDMLSLLVALAHGRLVSDWACRRMWHTLERQRDRSRMSRFLPVPDAPVIGRPSWPVVGSKSGNVRGLCHDVGIVHAESVSYAVAIFTQGIPDDQRAAEFVGRLSERLYSLLTGTAPSA